MSTVSLETAAAPYLGFSGCTQCGGCGYVMNDGQPPRGERCIACVGRFDLTTLNNEQLTERLATKIDEADELMRKENAGGLTFGWDWPTFSVIYPELFQEIIALKLEGRKRGLHKGSN